MGEALHLSPASVPPLRQSNNSNSFLLHLLVIAWFKSLITTGDENPDLSVALILTNLNTNPQHFSLLFLVDIHTSVFGMYTDVCIERLPLISHN